MFRPTRSGNYRLYLRSYSSWSASRCNIELVRNGVIEKRILRAYFGGDPVYLPEGVPQGASVHTALRPGGVQDTMLYGIDGSGNLRVVDDNGGVGLASKMTAPVFLKRIIVGTRSTREQGAATLIVNDASQDRDNDGLGPQLEASLCICDHKDAPTCGISCSQHVHNTIDSDGDGIRDDYEVLGREKYWWMVDDYPQHLPAWGADPRRKDVFVEVDLLTGLSATVNGVLAMIAPFNAPGTADVLHNRDGSDGIAVHVDAGITPTNATETRYGDWGGHDNDLAVGATYSSPDYQRFALSRRGIFRYGIALGDGGGQGTKPGANFATSNHLGLVAAHELGHALGLDHWGADRKGMVNGKPNYPSLMSYAPHSGFSRGRLGMVNPVRLNEWTGIPNVTSCAQIDHLRHSPFMFTLQQGWGVCHVDWNRDGVFTRGKTVQDSPTWGFGVDDSPELGRYHMERENNPLFKQPGADGTAAPSLARAFGRLHIAHRSASGDVRLVSTPDVFGQGCSSLTKGCASWTEHIVNVWVDASRGPLIAATGNNLLLVWVSGGSLRYQELDANYQVVGSGNVPSGSYYVTGAPVAGRDANDNVVVYPEMRRCATRVGDQGRLVRTLASLQIWWSPPAAPPKPGRLCGWGFPTRRTYSPQIHQESPHGRGARSQVSDGWVGDHRSLNPGYATRDQPAPYPWRIRGTPKGHDPCTHVTEITCRTSANAESESPANPSHTCPPGSPYST